jgi:hypothetical protein
MVARGTVAPVASVTVPEIVAVILRDRNKGQRKQDE